MRDYNRVLVTVDLMECSLELVKQAKDLAEKFNAKISLLHVVEPVPVYGFAYVQVTDVETEILAQAKKQMNDIGEALSIPVDEQYIAKGFPKQIIVQVAKDLHADLIVLGTQKLHGGRHVIGSTTNAVIHHADCDVWVVRTDRVVEQ